MVSRAFRESVRCRFVHLLPGIATRHSDTIDCIFLVNGEKVTVAISCAALAELREREQKSLTDQQLAETSALLLRRALEAGNDPAAAEFFVGATELKALARELGYL